MSDFDDDYVAGDINRIDDGYTDDTDDGDDYNEAPRAPRDAPTAAAVLTYVARSLADEPDAVSVDARDQGHKVLLSLNVSQVDMGRVIGRRGRTAQALRTIVAAAGSRDGVTTAVDIVD